MFLFHVTLCLEISHCGHYLQVDAEFKLKDMKRAYKELEIKGKGYKKRLDELQTAISKHLEQYVIRQLFGD